MALGGKVVFSCLRNMGFVSRVAKVVKIILRPLQVVLSSPPLHGAVKDFLERLIESFPAIGLPRSCREVGGNLKLA